MSSPEASALSPNLSFRDRLLLGLLRTISRLSLGVLQTLGFWLGWVASLFPRGPAWVIRRNLQLCFPDRDEAWLRDTIRRNLISTGQTGFEFAKTWGMPPQYSLARMKRIVRQELLDEALASGKGLLIIVPHYGTWEFMNAWINARAPSVIMYKPSKNKAMDTFVLEARSRLDAELVPTDERGVKALLKTLKKGGVSIILPDHVPHDNGGIFAPFFGIRVWTGILTSRLIQKTGCNVLMMSCVRIPGDDGFEVTFDPVDPDVHHDDLETAVSALNRSMETLIRRDPSQYQWTYKRFKKCESLHNVYQ